MAVAFDTEKPRLYFKAGVLNFFLWALIAIAAGHALAEKHESPWAQALFIWCAFVAMSFVWWATRSLVDWLLWRLVLHKAAANHLVASFEKHGFPRPPTLLSSPEYWFSDLAMGEESATLSINQRISAAAHYLRITEFHRHQGFFAMLRAIATYETAIADFRASFRSADGR